MSHSDLAAEVLRLDAEATPKPWHEEHVQRFADDATGTQYTGGTGMVFDDDNVLVCDTNETDCADAELIAHYRTAAPTLALECQRLAAEACPPLVWESNHEAGDGQDVCEACGTELEEPHTWRECVEVQRVAWRRDDKIGEEMHLEEVHRLAAELDRMAEYIANFCDTAEMAATQHDTGGMRVPYHGDFGSVPPSAAKHFARWAARGRALLTTPTEEPTR